MAVGLPASGKSTWFESQGVIPLSSDKVRKLLFSNVQEQRYQGLVFVTLRTLLRSELVAKVPFVYLDATSLTVNERRQWIKLATSFGYNVIAIFFDTPLSLCLQRNAKRSRQVPNEVIRSMALKLQPPSLDEGFTAIYSLSYS